MQGLEQRELNCVGERCPAPILKIAKAARSLGASGGGVLDVSADDPAFVMDLKSWCVSSKAELMELVDDDGVHRARLRVAPRTTGGTLVTTVDAKVPTAANRPPPSDAQPPAPVALVPRGTTVDLRDRHQSIWRALLDEAHSSAQAGDYITVLGDSPALPQVVLGWCNDTANAFLKFDASGPIRAELQITTPVAQTTALAVPAADNRCTLLVLHNDHEALLAALLVAVGAASQGKDVTIFFTFWGLNLLRGDRPNPNESGQKISFMQRMMKWMMPKGPKRQKLGQMNFGGAGKAMLGHIMRTQNLMELPALLETAEEQGVRFIACTMSMEVMGITKQDLAPRTNLEFGGVAAFVEAAHGSGMSLVF